jgi:hypothetical protein
MGQYGKLKRVSAADYTTMLKSPDAYFELEATAPTLDLDKAWHGMHFLLTGTDGAGDTPLNFIFSGDGTPLGVDEDERDPDDDDQTWQEIIAAAPSGFSPPEVQAIHRALVGLSEATIESRLQPGKLNAAAIYPAIWDRPEEWEANRAWLLTTFVGMKQFVAEAAAKGEALIVELDLG